MKFKKLFVSGLSIALATHAALASELAPLDKAVTLAQILNQQGQKETLLVLGDTGHQIEAINLSQMLNVFPEDPLAIVEKIGYERIALKSSVAETQAYQYQTLLPAGGGAREQVAAGTNYEEHGEEASIDEVFLFPKYAQATPAITTLSYNGEQLLDYEVELCLRWSQDIASVAEAKAAVAGVFVCGDMTDRAALLRNLNLDDIASGHGFSDAKSGDDRFPTGPYIVVPRDWESFVNEITLSTWVNGELRQNAQASEMIMPPTALIEWILKDGTNPLWRYEGQPVPLLEHTYIQAGQSVITGTPEGVVFNAPGMGYQVRKGLKWLFTFSFLDSGPLNYVIEEYIEENVGGDRYLKPGDKVQLAATYLGKINIDVIKK
ncbi:fumarylacetoacetate hydrolase family protein [Thaumasiovibrio subtropicus]|uniref:fumarylacetoacetate hydrolase family protein n=1 Tax=Thaumasiovibrio subtropicus TaxID=1891207 RepID=UPI000B351DB9|nr:fumarylacetoacetate hydrolase family protein [Thaumasiovibrio subtropicus]